MHNSREAGSRNTLGHGCVTIKFTQLWMHVHQAACSQRSGRKSMCRWKSGLSASGFYQASGHYVWLVYKVQLHLVLDKESLLRTHVFMDACPFSSWVLQAFLQHSLWPCGMDACPKIF